MIERIDMDAYNFSSIQQLAEDTVMDNRWICLGLAATCRSRAFVSLMSHAKILRPLDLILSGMSPNYHNVIVAGAKVLNFTHVRVACKQTLGAETAKYLMLSYLPSVGSKERKSIKEGFR